MDEVYESDDQIRFKMVCDKGEGNRVLVLLKELQEEAGDDITDQ